MRHFNIKHKQENRTKPKSTNFYRESRDPAGPLEEPEPAQWTLEIAQGELALGEKFDRDKYTCGTESVRLSVECFPDVRQLQEEEAEEVRLCALRSRPKSQTETTASKCDEFVIAEFGPLTRTVPRPCKVTGNAAGSQCL